jgi:hypothetical protein
MKKFLLLVFIMFDIALIGAGAFVLYGTVTHKVQLPALPALSKPMIPNSVVPSVTPSPTTPTPAPSAKAIGGGLLNPVAPNDSSARKILFTYRNPHVRQVSIRADFTGWKAQPMVKATNGSWTYFAQLTPGEYAYCFTADDKTFKDPANKRTKVIGRTTVSAIMVEARPAKAPK